MAYQNLTELDAAFTQRPAARVVSKLALQPGGVDPLGLRQINLDLMDWALPGINNVTTMVRPYVLMAWAWWKAAEIAQAKGGSEVPLDKLYGIVERIETVFIWSHILTGHSEGLPGNNTLSNALPGVKDPKAHSFAGKVWEKLRRARRANTSLMSAVQYGPSIRTQEGIGWLAPTKKGALVPVDDVMPAVLAFDALVAPHLPPILTSFEGGALTSKAAAKLYPNWATAKPTAIERKVFRQIFFDRGKNAAAESREFRRYATLQLISAVTGATKQPIDAATIRRMMCSLRKPNKSEIKIAPELVSAHRCWVALQARQLQRIGLEALLVWIETRIDKAGGTADAAALASEAYKTASNNVSDANKNVRAFRAEIAALGSPYGWPTAAAMGGKADMFNLRDKIIAAQEEKDFSQLPGLALIAIAIAAEVTDALVNLGEGVGLDDLLGGPNDRLPLALASRRLAIHADASMQTLWNEIIESWVLGQHVRWSVVRSGDETQRLRLAVDEGGWVRLRSKLSGPFRPTSDRLVTALALSANCGILKRTQDNEPRYTLA